MYSRLSDSINIYFCYISDIKKFVSQISLLCLLHYLCYCSPDFYFRILVDIYATMRFKKGSKVEVLSKREAPSGSWQCAEIISSNGHNYTVRYEGLGGATIVERVSRKDIRPCPPPVEVSADWVSGDLVEVFHNSSWKLATISKVVGKKYVLVRLLGSSREHKVSKFDVRFRQFWQDDQWTVIGKVISFSSFTISSMSFIIANYVHALFFFLSFIGLMILSVF